MSRNTPGPRMVHLTRAECRNLLSHCERDLRNLVTGAPYTGCRLQELFRMKVEDVGRDGFGVYIGQPKTRQPRFVFLPDEGMAFFLKLAAKKAPTDLVFTKEGRPWNHHKFNFRKTVAAARVPKGFSFHGLRHTYASQLVQAGAPRSVVAEQLGHVSTMTVSRTYGHIAPQVREAEVRQRFVSLKAKGGSVLSKKETKVLIKQWERRHDASAATYAKITDLKSRRNIR